MDPTADIEELGHAKQILCVLCPDLALDSAFLISKGLADRVSEPLLGVRPPPVKEGTESVSYEVVVAQASLERKPVFAGVRLGRGLLE